eukprot:SAG31_NODE_2090_length_6472_cov_4.683352_5_plen_149_part_00
MRVCVGVSLLLCPHVVSRLLGPRWAALDSLLTNPNLSNEQKITVYEAKQQNVAVDKPRIWQGVNSYLNRTASGEALLQTSVEYDALLALRQTASTLDVPQPGAPHSEAVRNEIVAAKTELQRLQEVDKHAETQRLRAEIVALKEELGL